VTSGPAWGLAAVLLLFGCAKDAPLPADPATVAITMAEHRFDFDRDQAIRPGRVVFEATNRGQRNHELVLLALPADLPGTLNDQLHSSTTRPVDTVAALSVRRPRQSGSFAVDLAPGRYGWCASWMTSMVSAMPSRG
jgi:hypothetical protein